MRPASVSYTHLYYVTSDGCMILSSEVGVLPVPEEKIILKERLHPGKMLLVDTVQGKIIDDNELKEMYAKKQPYGEWLDSNLVHLKDIKIPNERMEEYTEEQRSRLQKAFGYTYEQYRTSIRNMALNGAESIDVYKRQLLYSAMARARNLTVHYRSLQLPD